MRRELRAGPVEEYFANLQSEVGRAYAVAERARAVGLDPEFTPEIPQAEDMAMRVEKLLGHLHLDGIALEIRALSEGAPARGGRRGDGPSPRRRLGADPLARGPAWTGALRVGLAILTEGILVAPLEGLAEIHVRHEGTSSAYLELYYAGPIRAAGGTAQALSVLLADIVRRDVGLGPYVPQAAEVERYQEEIPLYKHLQHLQYVPSAEEIELVARHVPVCISGEATEVDAEVSAFRNLPRVPTNGVRGGACLVIAEGICQKAPKLQKIVERLALPGWEFLGQLGRRRSAEEEAAHGPRIPRRGARWTADPRLPEPPRRASARVRPGPHRGPRLLRGEPGHDGDPAPLRRDRHPGQAR